ncbi:UNVERIFIED_CONTAM: hypothetical protein PYX00_001276 [Menopon gallinae]|uniref:RRM domain-containing protein n=1 Tax=Menopon gallinae TaxID=328185 RepID=A0AAW2ICJ5_9NEOP
MSVIIRLQNLPWSANSLDIRHYFRGLSIPEGGVHIVGGEMGDAFIAFSTDEDARQAMMMAGGKIKEVQISLMLSSRNEMQKVIEAARQASMTNSLAQLLGAQNVPPVQLGQQATAVGHLPMQLQQQNLMGKDRRESRDEKKDSSDLSTSSYDTVKRDKKEKSRSRSRDRMRKDRRDRDRDRDKRRRSRSRSRSRDRRRRRSRSRSRGRDNHGRDRERKDPREDMKKEKEIGPGNNSLQDSTNLPNLDILNPNQWRMVNPGTLAQNMPAINSLTNLEILRNFTGAKPLLPGNNLGGGSVPLLGNDQADRFQNMQGNEDMNFGGRGRGEFPNRRDNRDGFNRNNDNSRDGMGRGNFRNFDDGNQQNFQGNFGFNEGNSCAMGGNFGNMGFQPRNGNEGMNNQNRFGNFNSGPQMMGNNNREQRGLLEHPIAMPNDGFNRNDRFDPNRDDRVDEFGRSIQLRNRKKNTDDSDEFQRNQQGNFQGFQNRFSNNQNSGPQPLLRGRDSWPPGRQGDGFQDRRFNRFDDNSRNNFRNHFSDGRNRSRRDDFHGGRERTRFSDKNARDEKDCCVEIRGLSPGIAYGDVRRPFNNLKVIIKDIKFFDYTKTDKKCRLKFLNYESKKRAMQNPKKIIIENKQVQLIHITDTEFDECVDEGVRRADARFSDDEEDESASEAYLQVTDLLPEHVEEDVEKMLSPACIDKIVIDVSEDGKIRTALVKFKKSVDAKVALGTPCRKIGDSSVMLMPLTESDFKERTKNGDAEESMETDKAEVVVIDDEEKSTEEVADGETDCILMKNLPLEASDRDICDFFSDIGLVPKRIHLMLDARGQPSGDAYCEFSESGQAQSACSKNGMPMGKNVLLVQRVSRAEVNDALGVKSDAAPGQDCPTQQAEKTQCLLAVENIPFRASVFDIINFFGWSYKLTEEDIVRKYNDRGQPTGDAKVTFRTTEDAMKAVKFLNNRTLMGRPIRMRII